MAIDTSIYSQLGQGVTKLENPMQMAAQAAQLSHMAKQGKLLDAQVAEATQAQADAAQLRDVAKGAVSPEDLEDKVLAVGTPAAIKLHHELSTARLTTDKAKREAQLTHTMVEKDLMDQGSQIMGGVLALPPEQKAQGWSNALEELGKLDPERTAKLPQEYPGDEAAQALHVRFMGTKEQLALAAQTQLKAHQDATLAEQSRHNKASEATALLAAKKPNAATVILNSGIGPNFDPSQALDAGQEARAHTIGRWDQEREMKSSRTPDADKVNARAEYLAKNQYGHAEGLPGKTDVQEMMRGKVDFGPSGNNGKTLQSIDVATQHVQRLRELGEALQNGNAQAVNKASNYFSQQFGGSKVTNYGTVQSFVIPEVLKVAKGAGLINQQEEDKLTKLTGGASSPAQIKGFADELQRIMGARAVAMEPSFKRYFPTHEITERLKPDTVKAFQALGLKLGAQGQPSGSAAPGSSPAVLNARPMATLADGSKVQLSEDGKSWMPVTK